MRRVKDLMHIFLEKTFCIKLKKYWEGEEEWRVVHKEKDVHYEAKDITNIIVGYKMEDAVKNEVKEIVKETYPNLEGRIQVAKIDPRKVGEVIIEPL